MKQALFALLVGLSVNAYADSFLCSFEAAACSMSDKTAFQCDKQKLVLKTARDLNCPGKVALEVPVADFGLNKLIQMQANCGSDNMLQLITLDQLSTTVARAIGTTMVPSSLGAANLFTVVARENGTYGENRVLLNMICIRKKVI